MVEYKGDGFVNQLRFDQVEIVKDENYIIVEFGYFIEQIG